MADDVLCSGVRGITDLMLHPGLINLDFADIKTIMHNMGTAMLGTGEASGEGRALKAAETAISNPLLDEMSLDSAKGVIINITGGSDLTLFEVDEAANHIRKEVDENANIIVGSAFHGDEEGKMRVSIVATGVTYLKQSGTKGAFATDDYDEDATTLHFEVGEEDKDLSASLSVADDEEEEKNQHVGVVDDFAMPEAAEVEDDFVPEEVVKHGPGDNLSEPEVTETASTPSYQIKEMRAEDNGPFDEAKRRSLFQESIEFVADEEDPPLMEEVTTEATKKSLFGRMASGLKGVFSGPDEVFEDRAEPSMGELEGASDAPDAPDEPDNILNMEENMDVPEIFEPENIEDGAKEGEALEETWDEETTAEDDPEDDQLAIPSFLRKQA